VVEWFARNGVAANLLMFVIVVGGLMTVPTLKQEVFPEFTSDTITVSVAYLGATPEEVEESVCVRIEEAVQGLSDIKRMTSTAREGMGTVSIKALENADIRHLLDEVKARVDTIDTFPDETERPIVQEAVMRRQVIDVVVHGDGDEITLRNVAERVRDDISAIDGISVAEFTNARDFEISIEVSESSMRRYGLTFDEVTRAVRNTSVDRPGGSVDTVGGEILVRSKGQRYRGEEFETITIRAFPDGTRVRIEDVATVRDGFEESDQWTRFDGDPALVIGVFRVGSQSALEISEKVREYVEKARYQFPEGVHLTTWQDDANVLRSRLDLLLRNGRMGLVLVFISLALFLKLRLAFWVALGIPISFFGAIWLLPAFDMSINVISLFAFIVVLGIVVDDAIIVGENIYTHQQRGGDGLKAAVRGTMEVALPVVFAVLTTVAVFSVLLGVPGTMGKVMAIVPAIVISTLFFSLIESLFILPRHLSHVPDPKQRRFFLVRAWELIQSRVDGALQWLIRRAYKPCLEWCLQWRWLTLAICLSGLLMTFGFFLGGHIKSEFFPKVDADAVVATVSMPEGTSIDITENAVRQLEKAAAVLQKNIDAEFGKEDGSIFLHTQSSVGVQPYREAQNQRRGDRGNFSGSHLGEVTIELRSSEDRPITSTEIVRRWRELVGPIPDTVEVSYSASLFSAGEPINVQLTATDSEKLRAGSEALKKALAEIAGVQDITDSFRAGKREMKLTLREDVEHLGLVHADLAHQVRQGFYGEEAQRVQRGRDEVKVMVRYPRDERRSLGDIENMRVRTSGGAELPFLSVATVEHGRGYAAIERAERRRVINVTADVDATIANANEINAQLNKTIIPRLRTDYPGLDYSMEGEQREQRETMTGLARGFAFALVLVYVLLAIPFKSYFQPLIVMSAIPFGIAGAMWGHVLLGMSLTMLSTFGFVALTGVIVNDSLVMVDFINRKRREGASIMEAIRTAGVARFRPILLTSLTTFAGLTPLLLEKSMQARFLMPMAISLGFGVLFATAITLILVPTIYSALQDLGGKLRDEAR
jgi:multidrug efflux pump subunit AcrB